MLSFRKSKRPVLSQAQYDFFCYFLLQHTGITIGPGKSDLIVNRLEKRLLQLGVNYAGYILKLKEIGGFEKSHFINALTTNKTDFFRENMHFDFLEKIVLEKFRDKTIYIWSAACSTGEEVYTIAMILEKLKESLRFDYKILGTDINTEVLDKAKKGIYTGQDFQLLPEDKISEYFQVHRNGVHYKVDDSIRKNVKFRFCNLNKYINYPVEFDVIFLRNVMIYFSEDMQKKVIKSMYNNLGNSGFLILAHAESILAWTDKFNLIENSIYEKVS